MPLTEKGKKIKAAMVKKYGKKKGEEVFYASQKKGTITGTHEESAREKLVKKVKKGMKKAFPKSKR